MKNFSKVVLTFLFVVAVAPAFAQLSLGADVGLPNGDWSKFYTTGYGVSLRYEHPIKDKLNWTISAGLVSFTVNADFPVLSSWNIIPATAGVKYYFQKANSGFYGGADLSLYYASGGLYYFSGGASEKTSFGLAPAVGYRIKRLDLAVRYNAVTDFSYLGFRAALVFGRK